MNKKDIDLLAFYRELDFTNEQVQILEALMNNDDNKTKLDKLLNDLEGEKYD